MKYERTVNTIEREVLFKNDRMIHTRIFIIWWFTFICIILYVILWHLVVLFLSLLLKVDKELWQNITAREVYRVVQLKCCNS